MYCPNNDVKAALDEIQMMIDQLYAVVNNQIIANNALTHPKENRYGSTTSSISTPQLPQTHWQPSLRQSIIPPVDRALLAAELTPDQYVRTFKGLEVYIFTANEAPHVMQEIGRIREVEFRRAGGGTGQSIDIDSFDIGELPYRQLVVWDSQEQELVAMYRYMLGRDALRSQGEIALATAHLFDFSATFQRDYLPYTIELGRAVVNRSAKKRLLGLFVVWSGLGALVREYPDLRYFFGKSTLFPTYHPAARDTLLHFLQVYFPDPDNLVRPRLQFQSSTSGYSDYPFTGCDYAKEYAQLKGLLKQRGETIPSLLMSYMDLTHTMKTFGTIHDPDLGHIEDTGILVTIADINSAKCAQFADSYTSVNPDRFHAKPQTSVAENWLC